MSAMPSPASRSSSSAPNQARTLGGSSPASTVTQTIPCHSSHASAVSPRSQRSVENLTDSERSAGRRRCRTTSRGSRTRRPERSPTARCSTVAPRCAARVDHRPHHPVAPTGDEHRHLAEPHRDEVAGLRDLARRDDRSGTGGEPTKLAGVSVGVGVDVDGNSSCRPGCRRVGGVHEPEQLVTDTQLTFHAP